MLIMGLPLIVYVRLYFWFPAFFVFPGPKLFSFSTIGYTSIGRIAFQYFSCPGSNVCQMTKQGTLSPFINWRIGFFFSPDGFKEVDNVRGGHITTTTEIGASFTSGGFVVPDQFPITVKQFILTPVYVHRPLGSINYRTSVRSIGFLTISTFPVPLDGFVIIKLKNGIHGIVHGPTIIDPMVFS